MNSKKLLGKRIKEIRKNKGLTQEKLAEMIDIETTSLSGIESGRHYPSLLTLEKISQNLNTNIMTLFDFGHLQSSEEMKSKIIDSLDKLDNDKLAFVYDFITKFANN